MNRAVELLAQKAQRGRPRRGGEAAARARRAPRRRQRSRSTQGRYGPYVKWEKVNATLPKDVAPEAVTLEQALELIAAKPRQGAEGRPAKGAAKKAASDSDGQDAAAAVQ